jgi:predicted TIM-barrel fold metal-dependent hydrolase
MKIIAVEEHYMSPAVNEKYNEVMSKIGSPAVRARLGFLQKFFENTPAIRDLDELRIAAMDRQGVDMQVISYGNNSPMDLPAEAAIPLCRLANDELAAAVRRHPARFAGFAALPVADPKAAADELSRAVNELGLKGASLNGTYNGVFFDEPEYFPIFQKADELDVPVYFHPGFVDERVSDHYYKGSLILPQVTATFSAYGFGWHADAGIHMMRMILSGIFQKLPDLKLMTGHWGELVPYYFDRIDEMIPEAVAGLGRPFSEIYREHVYISPSGIASKAPAMLAIGEMGADHVLWSHDYPYVKREDVRDFLMGLPISEEDREKLACKNAEKLLKL